MNISIKYGTDNIDDWVALCEIFKLAPLGTREPRYEKHTLKAYFTYLKHAQA